MPALRLQCCMESVNLDGMLLLLGDAHRGTHVDKIPLKRDETHVVIMTTCIVTDLFDLTMSFLIASLANTVITEYRFVVRLISQR